MRSEKLLQQKYDSFRSYSGSSGLPIALLVTVATGTSLFVFGSLPPTLSRGEFQGVLLTATNTMYVGEDGSLRRRGSIPFRLVVSDRAQNNHAAINILQQCDVIEKASPAMAAQIADARKFALALPSGLKVPRAWTDGESELVLEWINGDKHAIVSFEGNGDFGYAMRQGDRFAPGASPNDIDVAALDDLVDYLARI